MEYNRTATCAERIKTALLIRGMRQSDLCKITNIPKSALSQYISGAYDPKQDRIYIISKALNVSEAWLMGLDVPMERAKKINSSEELTLSEGEKNLLIFYRSLSDEAKKVFDDAIGSLESFSEEKQKLALQMLHFALGNQ